MFEQDEAVSSFEISIDLPAPPQRAWQFVVEHGAEVEPLTFEPQGEQGIGTLNHVRRRILGVPIRAVSRTTAWEPPRRCAFESTKPTWPVTAHIVELFEPSAAGTHHVISYQVRPSGVVGHLVAPVFAAFMKRNRRQYQRRLRDALHRTT